MIDDSTNIIFDNRPEPLSHRVSQAVQSGIQLESEWLSGKVVPDPLPVIIQQIESKLREFLELPEEWRILLTSSYIETINSAIKGSVWGIEERRDEIAIVRGDPGGFAEATAWCNRLGFKTVHLPLKTGGEPDIKEWKRLITPQTAIVAISSVTPEVHVKRNFRKIKSICSHSSALLMMDFTEQCSIELVNLKDESVDILSIGSMAFGCPTGIGIMGIKFGIRYAPLITGDLLQNGLRSGRFRISLLMGLQVALAEYEDRIERRYLTMDRMHALAVQELSRRLPGVKIPVAANNLKSGLLFFVPGIEGEALVLALEMKNLFATTGSSCSSEAGKPSQTLMEMGYAAKEVSGAIHIAFREAHTEESIVRAVQMIDETVRELWHTAGYAD